MTLSNKIQKMELKKYENENVKKCTTDIFDKCNRLETAGKLPKNIGLIVCEILAACSVEEFCLQFMMKRLELTSNPSLAADYQELIILANSTYQTLVDAGKWLVMPPEDTALMTLHAKMDKLIQAKVNWRKKHTCFRCGKEGHFAHQCPQAQEKPKEKKDVVEEKKLLSWKRIALKAGDPEEKLFKGKSWKWCAMCSRWSLTHSTAEHKGPIKPKNLKGHTTNISEPDEGPEDLQATMLASALATEHRSLLPTMGF